MAVKSSPRAGQGRGAEGPVLTIEGRDIPLRFKVHARARRITLRVDAHGSAITVTAPSRRAYGDALAFAERERAWIARRLERIGARILFVPGASFPLRGAQTVIAAAPKESAPVTFDEAASLLLVSGRVEHADRRGRDFLTELARRDLKVRVGVHCAALSLHVPRLVVRDPKARWGSCSANGPLSFSWRLIMAPEYVLDYVAAHEVAHLAEMNHGPRFHTLVKSLTPRVRCAEAWLKEKGHLLHRYGAAR